MKYIIWDEKKNEKLKKERGISFEEIYLSIQEGKILDIIDNPNKKRYPNQRIIIVNFNQYAYLIPFVEDNEKYFLKTVIPSRKMTRKYLKGGV